MKMQPTYPDLGPCTCLLCRTTPEPSRSWPDPTGAVEITTDYRGRVLRIEDLGPAQGGEAP